MSVHRRLSFPLGAVLLCGTCMPALAQTAQPEVPQTPSASSTAADASAGQQTPADQGANAASDEGAGDIVVTGIRASLAKSIDLKREAIGIRDSIVAEDIGKFPEKNIADALQRIPGVELVRDGLSNEGQRIQLRGLGSEFTVTTFNGIPVRTTSQGAAGSATRDFNYDVFPSELFGRADVYKTPLAELQEGGVAGNVDLRTPRPFDNPKRQIRYALQETYNSQSRKADPRFHGLFSDTFGNFGVLLQIAQSTVRNNRSGFESTAGYNSQAQRTNTGAFNFILDDTNPLANLNGLTTTQVENAILPRFVRVYGSANERNRLGASGSLQYKNDRLDVSVDGLYAKLKDSSSEQRFGWPVRNTTAPIGSTTRDPVSGAIPRLIPLNVTIDANNRLNGTFGNATLVNSSTVGKGSTEFRYVGGNAAYKLGDDLRLSAQVAQSRSVAQRNTASVNIEGESALHTITLDFTGDPLYPEIATDRDPLDRSIYQRFTYTGASFRKETDKQRSARLALDWDFGSEPFKGHVKVGASIDEATKLATGTTPANLLNGVTIPGVGAYGGATAAQQAAFAQGFLQPLQYRNLAPDAPKTFIRNWLTLTPDFFSGQLDAFNQNRSAPTDFSSTFEARETTKAAFVQSDLTTTILGRQLRGNVGVRYVQTDLRVGNFSRTGTGTFVPLRGDSSYDRWLPSASLAYDVSEKVVVRGAWSKTLTRSSLSDIARPLSFPINNFNPVIQIGNPDLQPQFSTGLDVSAEWYFEPGGILSIGGFRKVITGRPLSQSTFAQYSELDIPVELLGSTLVNGAGQPIEQEYEVRTVVNAQRYVVQGAEFAYQQNLRFLPKPFDGLGATASLTYIQSADLLWTGSSDGDANAPGVQKISALLNVVPKITANVTAFYEKGPFALRGSYSYKTKFAPAGTISSNLGSDFQRFSNARGYLDASISYKLFEKLELRIDGQNLTDTRAYDYFVDALGRYGDPKTRVENAYTNGRSISFGIRGSF